MPNDKFHILTFGCQMNVNDSDWLEQALIKRNLEPTTEVSANIIIINTCSVREKPEQKVIQTIKHISATKNNPRTIIVIIGCVAQQLGTDLFKHSPKVRLIAGTDCLANVPNSIIKLIQNPELKISLLDFTNSYTEKEIIDHKKSNPISYVNIMQGCDNFCTYCIVPFTRGRQKSRDVDAILNECTINVKNGAKEICLLGQNVNAFGLDRADSISFANLIREISKIKGLKRIRYVTPHPKDMTDEDIALFSEIPILCPRLHLPIQSGSNNILKRMNRRYTREIFIDLVNKLKSTKPDIALSTDLIVGFPNESDSDFNDTLEIMKTCQFMSSFSFCYSDRPGTKATLLPDKISKEIQLQRLQILQTLQENLSSSWLNNRINKNSLVLIEKKSIKNAYPDTNSWQGHDEYGCIIHVHFKDDLDYTGQIIPVKIIEAKKHSLVGIPKDN